MAYDFSQVKILIVDDMAPMLTLTINLMGRFGISQVHGAKGVEEAYKLYRQHKHDLVITDWLMEPYDGLDLIRLIRKDNYSPDKFVPIILMTGYTDRSRVEAARDMGVTEFLMKPFNVRDLYSRIVQIIEKPRQFVESGEFFGPDRRRRKDSSFNSHNRRSVRKTNAAQDEPDQNMADILKSLRDDTKQV